MYNFFFQAEDGIRDRSPSRGLGDVYKRQQLIAIGELTHHQLSLGHLGRRAVYLIQEITELI